MKPRRDVPAAIVDMGGDKKFHVWGDYSTYGIPTVEVLGTGFDVPLSCMRPEDADRFADALKLAARLARGEVIPTELDKFMSKRGS